MFAITTFVSACLCFAPGQWVSGSMLLVASGVLWWRYVRSLPPQPAKDAAKPEVSPSISQAQEEAKSTAVEAG